MQTFAILLNTSWYIYNFRKNLIRDFVSKGFEVHAIAPYDAYTPKLIELGCIYHNIEFDSKSKNPIKDIQLLLSIRRFLKQIQPNILLNFTIKPNVYGSLACQGLNIKCINNIAGMGTLFSEGLLSRTLFKWLFMVSQREVSTVFFQNPDDFEELTKNEIVKKTKARLLPGSGVNLNEFPYSPLPLNKDVTFLLIARMIFPKGIDELVRASQILIERGYKNIQIQLLGEIGVNNPLSIPSSKMDDYCKNPHVTYLGKTDDVKSVIQKADVVVLPSYYREGTPKSLLEALAIGRPIITSNMPGCKETVIDNVNGFICEPKSVEDLALKMESYINLEEDKKQAMSIESRKLAENKYDEQIVIQEYLNAITKALK